MIGQRPGNVNEKNSFMMDETYKIIQNSFILTVHWQFSCDLKYILELFSKIC